MARQISSKNRAILEERVNLEKLKEQRESLNAKIRDSQAKIGALRKAKK